MRQVDSHYQARSSKLRTSKNKPSSTKLTSKNNHINLYSNWSLNSNNRLSYFSKLSLEYSPALGIYVLPEEDDFYSNLLLMNSIGWQFYMFVREGYYKDAKLKGIIRFDKQDAAVRIVEAAFLATVFHPLVQFETGNIDLSRLLIRKSDQNINECFTLLLKLKEMFIKEHYLSIKDSFNQ